MHLVGPGDPKESLIRSESCEAALTITVVEIGPPAVQLPSSSALTTTGAVGHAYHQLYEALLPIKDEYRVRLAATVDSPSQDSNEPHDERNLSLWT